MISKIFKVIVTVFLVLFAFNISYKKYKVGDKDEMGFWFMVGIYWIVALG